MSWFIFSWLINFFLFWTSNEKADHTFFFFLTRIYRNFFNHCWLLDFESAVSSDSFEPASLWLGLLFLIRIHASFLFSLLFWCVCIPAWLSYLMYYGGSWYGFFILTSYEFCLHISSGVMRLNKNVKKEIDIPGISGKNMPSIQ